MNEPKIVIDDAGGSVVCLHYGDTYIDDSGKEITYEQILRWIQDGSLQQHGFIPHKPVSFQPDGKGSKGSSCYRNMNLIAALIKQGRILWRKYDKENTITAIHM